MEIYAGFLGHTDHHVGRLIDALKDLEVLDDTLAGRSQLIRGKSQILFGGMGRLTEAGPPA
jgi:hypothetical protein